MTHPQRTARHYIPAAIAVIIAGLLTTIAVAWGVPVLRAYFPQSESNSAGTSIDLSTPQTITREHTNGWPFACTSSRQEMTITLKASGPIISTRTHNAYPVHVRHSPSEISVVLLAYRPRYLGLLANTLLYAAAWLALYRLSLHLRARRRIRRGACPHCAYDLKGTITACPECGQGSLAPLG